MGLRAIFYSHKDSCQHLHVSAPPLHAHFQLFGICLTLYWAWPSMTLVISNPYMESCAHADTHTYTAEPDIGVVGIDQLTDLYKRMLKGEPR